jgi:hypothetical protein
MRKPGILLLLILTLTIAFATAGQDYRFDQAIDRERTGGLQLAHEFASIDTALSDVRGAQAAYVAAGQEPAVWMTKATESFAQADAALTRLRQTTLSVEAKARYDEAAKALTEVIALDGRARDHAKSDRMLASDIIFDDVPAVHRRVAEELDAARMIDMRAYEARVSRLSQLRYGMNVATLGFVTLLVLLFGRALRREAPVSEPAAAAKADSAASAGLQLRHDPKSDIQRERPPVLARPDAKPAAAAQPDAKSRQPARSAVPGRESLPLRPSPAPPAMPVPPPMPANLTDVAELCVDLGRVLDSRDVPSLLERAANVLQAKGVVLWVADSAGAMLRPSITHGYAEKILSRLGPLQIDSDNVTSLAFRSMRPQTMSSSVPGAPSALAVPLLTASGCVGVLAAEVKQDKPASELLPLARIIAAQFAALIAPTEDSQGSFAATRSSL